MRDCEVPVVSPMRPLSDSEMLQGSEQPFVCLSAGGGSASFSQSLSHLAAAPCEALKSLKIQYVSERYLIRRLRNSQVDPTVVVTAARL